MVLLGAMKTAILKVLSNALPPLRKAFRFAAVFVLLLCAAETFLTMAVYLGYSGGTYLRRVSWNRDGSLTYSEFQAELTKPRVRMSAPKGSSSPKKNLPPCPLIPPDLEGPVVVDKKPPPSFHQLEEELSTVQLGGHQQPDDCVAHQKVAIIVPYRDRRVHLKMFLRHMHPFLSRQQLDYRIFVVELKTGIDFNRAMLFNIGFREALKVDNYTCFIFHDVDLLPEDDRNMYRCAAQPRHMSVAVDKMLYKLPYNTIFGGVSAMTKDQFQDVNGFSNVYFGWGGEDDDMFKRIRHRDWKVLRYTSDVARYKTLGHAKEKPNPGRIKLLHQSPRRFLTDGLNSLVYTRLEFEERPLYTWVLVEMDKDTVQSAAGLKRSNPGQ
nr:hypothetical protein BaRGS_022821 [Batillaria attramentaria]